MGHVVLVTGVARPLGRRLATLLQSAPDVDQVIGVDVVPPVPGELGRVEFVRADIRNPVIGKVIAAADVDTVVHLSVVTSPPGRAGRAAMKEINVIGTMQLLAACQKAPSVRRLIVKSSTSVYGCSPRDPALFTEDMEPPETPRSGYAKDAVEVEGYVRGFARRRPDVAVTTLRMANVLSPHDDSEFASYFALPVLPTVLGFDPRLQFLHEDDALEVLRRSVHERHLGTYNVAGEGVLLLSQAARRLGKPTLPLPSPTLALMGPLLRSAGVLDLSVEQLQLFTFGRAVDTTRLREGFGWAPARTTAATFEEFAAAHRVHGPITPERVAAAETTVQGIVTAVRGALG